MGILKMNSNKKSQMQMTEQVGVLIIFFILLVMGFAFYSRFQDNSFKVQEQELKAQKSIMVSLKASYLPELRCSTNNDLIVPNCIDYYKLIVMKKKFEDFNSGSLSRTMTEEEKEEQDFYSKLLRNSRLNISNLITQEGYLLYNGTKEKYTNKIQSNIPVLIYNSIEDKSYFGVLNVETFS